MANKRDKATKAAEKALREIAAMNEFPPAPAQYLATQRLWRGMIMKARKAIKQLDDLTGDDL